MKGNLIYPSSNWRVPAVICYAPLCVKTSLPAKPFIWNCFSPAGSCSCKPNSFSYERFCPVTRFETEAQSMSESFWNGLWNCLLCRLSNFYSINPCDVPWLIFFHGAIKVSDFLRNFLGICVSKNREVIFVVFFFSQSEDSWHHAETLRRSTGKRFFFFTLIKHLLKGRFCSNLISQWGFLLWHDQR